MLAADTGDEEVDYGEHEEGDGDVGGYEGEEWQGCVGRPPRIRRAEQCARSRTRYACSGCARRSAGCAVAIACGAWLVGEVCGHLLPLSAAPPVLLRWSWSRSRRAAPIHVCILCVCARIAGMTTAQPQQRQGSSFQWTSALGLLPAAGATRTSFPRQARRRASSRGQSCTLCFRVCAATARARRPSGCASRVRLTASPPSFPFVSDPPSLLHAPRRFAACALWCAGTGVGAGATAAEGSSTLAVGVAGVRSTPGTAEGAGWRQGAAPPGGPPPERRPVPPPSHGSRPSGPPMLR